MPRVNCSLEASICIEKLTKRFREYYKKDLNLNSQLKDHHDFKWSLVSIYKFNKFVMCSKGSHHFNLSQHGLPDGAIRCLYYFSRIIVSFGLMSTPLHCSISASKKEKKKNILDREWGCKLRLAFRRSPLYESKNKQWKKNDINAPRGTVIELEYWHSVDRFSGLEQILFCFKSARQKSNPLA